MTKFDTMRRGDKSICMEFLYTESGENVIILPVTGTYIQIPAYRKIYL